MANYEWLSPRKILETYGRSAKRTFAADQNGFQVACGVNLR